MIQGLFGSDFERPEPSQKLDENDMREQRSDQVQLVKKRKVKTRENLIFLCDFSN
jgi:hypothetical protein